MLVYSIARATALLLVEPQLVVTAHFRLTPTRIPTAVTVQRHAHYRALKAQVNARDRLEVPTLAITSPTHSPLESVSFTVGFAGKR